MEGLKLRLYPDDVLLKPCEEVTEYNEELGKLLDNMAIIMRQYRGVGLSANQLGTSKRIFIMEDQKEHKVIEFVNPKLVEASQDRLPGQEGCLSTPGVYVPIARPREVVIEAFSRTGEPFTTILEEIEARCACHELDHLNGVDFLSLTNRQARRAALRQLEKRRPK